jgi:hypothetical protein
MLGIVRIIAIKVAKKENQYSYNPQQSQRINKFRM